MTLFRALLSALAALALLLVPTAAVAYTGADEEVLVSESNPDPGEPFNVVVDAGTGSPEATLTVTSDDAPVGAIDIAGTQSMTKDTAAGVAEFTVTLHVEGRYTLIGTDASGNKVGESVVVVGDGEPGEDTAAGGEGGEDTVTAGLPATGTDAGLTLAAGAGVVLLVAGGSAMLYARRRKTGQAA